MLHAGVCVPRQYTAFAHIVVRPEHARFLRAPDGRAICHRARLLARRRRASITSTTRALYRAIGEPDNRHRRPATLARAHRAADGARCRARGARADVARDRAREGRLLHRPAAACPPTTCPRWSSVSGGARTVRYFPEKLPIGLAIGRRRGLRVRRDRCRPGGSSARSWTAIVGCCSACIAGPSGWPFRSRRWKARGCTPASLAEFGSAPLRPAVAEEFRWFCHARRALDDGTPSGLAFDAARFAARTPRLRCAALLRRLSAPGARAATPWSMSCCRRVSTMRGPAATDGLRSMFCHINTSASRPLSPQRESVRRRLAGGPEVGPDASGETWPPFASRSRCAPCSHRSLSGAQ